MSLSLRYTSAVQATLNQGLMSINPIRAGESVEVYANADADGDSMVVAIGTKTIATVELGVEAVAGMGPIVPDNLVAKWMQPPTAGPADLTIALTGDNIDVLIVKS